MNEPLGTNYQFRHHTYCTKKKKNLKSKKTSNTTVLCKLLALDNSTIVKWLYNLIVTGNR